MHFFEDTKDNINDEFLDLVFLHLFNLICFRHFHKSENLEDLKRDKDIGNSSCSRLRLPSPSSKKKQKKKYKKDSKKQPSRLLQERCVHCHELFSEVILD